MLSARGYRPARYFQKMVMDFSERPPSMPEDVPGIVVRTASMADDQALFEAYVEAFADHWGDDHPDPVQWWHERRSAPTARYDPDLWLVATEDDQLAGFVIAKVRYRPDGSPYGYVGDLGVRPWWRGRGLGELLLGRSLETFRERGLPSAELDVDTENTTGAVRLYLEVGMKSRPSFTIGSRQLP